MKVIVVGAGGVARALLRRLSEIWSPIVIDPSQEAIERANAIRPFDAVLGDGSSRLVLERAGLSGADALVATTGDDDANLESCRLAREAGVRRLVAVSNDPNHEEQFRKLGATVISPHGLAARRVELTLETRRVSSMAFADGRAEAIEFRVAADSPVRGKQLRDLHASSFIVGAVLREGKLVVPHGETVLEDGDLVTVVGAGSDFGEIVTTFTSGEVSFPLDYGKRVAVALERPADLDGVFLEALNLVRISRASSLLVLHRDPGTVDELAKRTLGEMLERAHGLADGVELEPRPVDGRPARELVATAAAESVGVIVLSAPGGSAPRSWTRMRHAAGVLRRSGRPVLLSRGSVPYRRLAVPARQTPSGRAAVRAAIDLARITGASIVGLRALDPPYLGGPESSSGAERAIGWLEEEAAVHGVAVEGRIVRGNPVRELSALDADAQLLVLGLNIDARASLAGRGVGPLTARRFGGSVLLVPAGAPD